MYDYAIPPAQPAEKNRAISASSFRYHPAILTNRCSKLCCFHEIATAIRTAHTSRNGHIILLSEEFDTRSTGRSSDSDSSPTRLLGFRQWHFARISSSQQRSCRRIALRSLFTCTVSTDTCELPLFSFTGIIALDIPKVNVFYKKFFCHTKSTNWFRVKTPTFHKGSRTVTKGIDRLGKCRYNFFELNNIVCVRFGRLPCAEKGTRCESATAPATVRTTNPS